MITYLLGLPGSGKSYYAVDRIFNNFSTNEQAKKDKKVTFKNCYTNINEFNFNTVQNTYPLDFDVLYKILGRAYDLYKSKKSDEYIVKFLKKVKLKDTLFVIDEAHNHFDRRDKILVWWLSYHRHLYHEIILITQSLSLIEAKYKQFSEFFYVAKPQSLILDKRFFKYNVFCSSRLSEKSKSGSIKLKRNKEVFKLYKSGDSINSMNVIRKFIIIGIFILLIIFLIVYYFKVSHTSPGVEAENKKTVISTKEITQHKNSKSFKMDTTVHDEDKDYNDLKLFKLSCSKNVCNNDVISIPPQLLNIFITEHTIKNLYTQTINKNLTVFYLECKKDFYTYLSPNKIISKADDEKNNHISIFGNNPTSSK